MSNPARKKGTAWEVELLDILREYFPDIERAPLKGTNDAGDFVNVPYPIEAKNTKTSQFPLWIRTTRAKALRDGKSEWLVIWKGDRRTIEGDPVVAMPLDMLCRLLQSSQEVGEAYDALLDEYDERYAHGLD